MSRRALSLPLRTRFLQPTWTCRRCLTIQTDTTPATPPPLPFESQGRTTDPLGPSISEGNDLNPLEPSKRRRRPERKPKPVLPHRIPPQYLQHCEDRYLNKVERKERAQTTMHQDIRGVVVSAGLMDKTVRVRVPGRKWNTKIGKYFASYTQHLVHDPNNSLIVGDVIQLHRLKISSQVFHVVGAITAPFGKPISERPPVPAPHERLEKYKQKRFAKLERRSLRLAASEGDAEAIKKLQSMGLDPGNVAETGQKKEDGKRDPVGKIDKRAKRNKESAMKMNEQAEANLLEADRREEELKEEGLSAEAELPRKSSAGKSQVQ